MIRPPTCPGNRNRYSSEEILLTVWLQHFNRMVVPIAPLSMYSLDTRNQRKLLHLLAVLPSFHVS